MEKRVDRKRLRPDHGPAVHKSQPARVGNSDTKITLKGLPHWTEITRSHTSMCSAVGQKLSRDRVP